MLTITILYIIYYIKYYALMFISLILASDFYHQLCYWNIFYILLYLFYNYF